MHFSHLIALKTRHLTATQFLFFPSATFWEAANEFLEGKKNIPNASDRSAIRRKPCDVPATGKINVGLAARKDGSFYGPIWWKMCVNEFHGNVPQVLLFHDFSNEIIPLDVIEFTYQSIALDLLYRKSFECNPIRPSVRWQNGRKVVKLLKDGADSGRFREFTTERLVQFQNIKKQSCRAFQELSIVIHLINICPQFGKIFNLKRLKLNHLV